MTETSSSVFVVDDDPSVREAVSSLLRSVGLHAEVFGSTAEFLKARRPEVPSCLVLDVKLPGVSGLEFQHELKGAGIQIPIIFITAHGDIPMSSRAMKAGAIDFLPKPFHKEDLLSAVHEALNLDRSRRQRPAEAPEDFGIALLNKMARRMSEATPLQEVLAEVVELVASMVECDSCFVYLLESEKLVLRASKNPHPELVDRLKLKLGQGITGWVAEHREPVTITRNALNEPCFKLSNELPEDHFEAFLSVPIVSGGRLVGVVALQNRAEHQFTPRDISLIAAVGFLVGTEVERARLESENFALSGRLAARKLIERAKGILQRDLGISEDDAYRSMQQESQQRRRSMKEIAEAVVLGDDLRRSSR